MASEFGKSAGKRLEIIESMERDAAEARKRLKKKTAKASAAKEKGSWKVLVYMAAYGALRPFAERDIFEMCMVEGLPSRQLETVVQVHWEEGKPPKRHVLKTGIGNSIRFEQSAAKGLTMAAAFEKFLKEELPSTSTDRDGHPQRCMVVLWGHAIDMQFGGFESNGMTLAEIRTAVSNARTAGQPLDVLGFDACDMSRLETIQSLNGLASILVASQIGVPFSGWPYNTILSRLQKSPGMDPKEVSEAVLDEFYESYYPPRVTLTALDAGLNGHYGELRSNVVGLVSAVDQVLSKEIAEVVQKAFASARRDVADPLVDLLDFCQALRRHLSRAKSVPAAQKKLVVRAIEEVTKLHKTLVRKHERRGPLVNGLHGIGISPYTITENWSSHLELYDKVGWRRPPTKPRGQSGSSLSSL